MSMSLSLKSQMVSMDFQWRWSLASVNPETSLNWLSPHGKMALLSHSYESTLMLKTKKYNDPKKGQIEGWHSLLSSLLELLPPQGISNSSDKVNDVLLLLTYFHPSGRTFFHERFLRKQESRNYKEFWVPAFARMTIVVILQLPLVGNLKFIWIWIKGSQLLLLFVL